MKNRFVLGLVFHSNRKQIALILKTHPPSQNGLLNGIGGKVESGESDISAMRREFLEETGVNINDWQYFSEFSHTNNVIICYTVIGDFKIRSTTDELVSWYKISKLASLPTAPKLIVLINEALKHHHCHSIGNFNAPPQ